MYFDTLTALWYMDGHGIYVWVAYALTAALLIAMVRLPISRFRRHWGWVEAERRRTSVSSPAETEEKGG
ncbi:MAG: heme exporter protein CcmD [Luminiphilus sp.]|nr:heme exporter protein CcmD [Luminiphilus sp.]